MSGIVIRSPVKGQANREVVLPLLTRRESSSKAKRGGSQKSSRRSLNLEWEDFSTPRGPRYSETSDGTNVPAAPRRVCMEVCREILPTLPERSYLLCLRPCLLCLED
jgi:hypothetical protein